ncbi:altered inheritance of mitochondria protein 18, mitochondrial [[Candida] railenensis]|uniref:Altered inheritance of mitochondria protein 18, mitochondrial n=1 Tax=[Candida] railenensis TaxID=45579 RepID=A0A9P0QT46_9ASCO|nr:altered inheritance of mitochondria protein 18, mitochondrial [[Candida] railenensis]
MFRRSNLLQTGRWLARSLSTGNAAPKKAFSSPFSRHFFIGASTAVVTFSVFSNFNIRLEAPPVNSSITPENSISVDSSIDAFPISISPQNNKNINTSFDLLGAGVRSVTFLGLKVYGIGLYLSTEDIHKVKQVISATSEFNSALKDPEQSTEFISKLLDSHTRFAVRICPVRNTDFTHLKDGLIKSILSHPLSKSGSPVKDEVSRGLEQLRDVFQGKKGSVPKNHLLWIEVLKDGKVSISYEDTKNNKLRHLGEVEEPMVGKVLFLQYLSGKKPLSEPLRTSCNEGWSKL